MEFSSASLGFGAGWFLCLFLHWGERRLLERRNSRNQTKYGYDRTPKPLPMRFVKAGNCFKTKPNTWPIVTGQEEGMLVWAVVRFDELAPPPITQPLSELVRGDHAVGSVTPGCPECFGRGVVRMPYSTEYAPCDACASRTQPAVAPSTATNQTKPTHFHEMLRWAAQDLGNPEIRGNADRLALEQQVVVKRLAPYIEEVVQLAWRQLQADQTLSSDSSRSMP